MSQPLSGKDIRNNTDGINVDSMLSTLMSFLKNINGINVYVMFEKHDQSHQKQSIPMLFTRVRPYC